MYSSELLWAFGTLVTVSVGISVFVCVEIDLCPRSLDETHPIISPHVPEAPRSGRGFRFLWRGEDSHECVVGRGPLDSGRRGK